MTKKRDPHISDLREVCIKNLGIIEQVISVKPSVTTEDKERFKKDVPELIEIINKSPLWPGHLSEVVKKNIDKALMKATQIDVKPSVPMANAYYGAQVCKMPRVIIEAQPAQKTDREAERLPEGHRDKRCSHCHKFVYRFDKHKNRIRPDKETGTCNTCKKYRERLQKQRTAMQKKSDAKGAKREAKANRGKPDPEYVKAMEKRKKELREGKYHGV